MNISILMTLQGYRYNDNFFVKKQFHQANIVNQIKGKIIDIKKNWLTISLLAFSRLPMSYSDKIMKNVYYTITYLKLI